MAEVKLALRCGWDARANAGNREKTAEEQFHIKVLVIHRPPPLVDSGATTRIAGLVNQSVPNRAGAAPGVLLLQVL